MDGINFIENLNKDILFILITLLQKGSKLYMEFFQDKDHKELSFLFSL